MKFRIVLVASFKGRAFERIRDGLKEQLRVDFAESIEVVERLADFYPEETNKIVYESIVKDEVDLIVSMGATSTIATYEETAKRRRKIPFIATGVPPLSDLNIPFCEHGMAVIMNPFQNILPAQLVFRAYPQLKTIFIPYDPIAVNGRSKHEARLMEKYFSDRGVAVLLMPVHASTVDPADTIKKLQQADLAISIAGGLTEKAIIAIAKLANKTKTPFWTDGSAAIERGAICGMINDFYCIGAISAEQIKKIMINKAVPGRLGTIEIPNSCHLEVNNKLAFQKGVVLTDDIEISFDHAFNANRELGTLGALFIIRYPELFNRSLEGEIGIRMRSDKDFVYQYETLTAWKNSTDAELALMWVHFDKMIKNKDIVFVFEDSIGQQIYQYMREKEMRIPIAVVTNKHEASSNGWHHEAAEHGIQVFRCFIQPPTLCQQFKVLHKLVPVLKTVHIPLFKEEHLALPPSVQHDLQQLEKKVAALGITLKLMYLRHYQDFGEMVIEPNTHWLLPEETFDPDCVNDFSARCDEANAVCVAGSLACARRFVASIGLDYRRLSFEIMPLAKKMLETKMPPSHRHIELTQDEWYGLAINAGRCAEYNLNAHTLYELPYQQVSVDHAADTMHSLLIMTFEEYEEIRQRKKERKKAQFQEPTRKEHFV